MKLTYQLNQDDLVAFYQHFASRSNVHRRRWRQSVFGIPILCSLVAGYFYYRAATATAVVYLVLAVVWFALWPVVMKASHKRYYKKHVEEIDGVLFQEPTFVELREGGLFSSNAQGQVLYKYTAIGDVEDVGRYTYIWLGKRMAIILPEDRIPRDQLVAFVEAVREKLNEGKN